MKRMYRRTRIARHLPGTYLDGAAMLSAFSQPVVALTLRYDRLDNFWFVLFHELAHVFLHLRRGCASTSSMKRKATRPTGSSRKRMTLR